MKTELNELVQRLMTLQEVECARPRKDSEALEQSIKRNYVHVKFTKTGTELGIQLDTSACKLEGADFRASRGTVHLEGGLTLNYNKVKCIADIDLATCSGKARLEPLTDEDYKRIMKQNLN